MFSLHIHGTTDLTETVEILQLRGQNLLSEARVKLD